MSVEHQRFTTFKRFVVDNAGNVPQLYMNVFSAMSLESFLGILREKSAMGMTPDEMAGKILDMCSLRVDDFGHEDLARFKRYLEYFTEVAACMA